MDINGIVEVLNTYIQSINNSTCKVVLHKTKKNAVMNAYKTYTWTLWLIVNGSKSIIGNITYTGREVTDTEEITNNKIMENKLLFYIYDILYNHNLIYYGMPDKD